MPRTSDAGSYDFTLMTSDVALLREIQRTGDIFFPTRWMESTLSSHSSLEVANTVRDFLAEELDYPQRLRWTILTAADDLLRRSDR